MRAQVDPGGRTREPGERAPSKAHAAPDHIVRRSIVPDDSTEVRIRVLQRAGDGQEQGQRRGREVDELFSPAASRQVSAEREGVMRG